MMQMSLNWLQAIQSKFALQKPSEGPNLVRALDLGRMRILFVEGYPQNGKIHLTRLEVVALNQDFSLLQGLKKLFTESKCDRKNILISLKSPQAVTRFLRFPKMTEKELRGVLNFEIEQYVPYESKNLYLDLAVLQESIPSDQGEVTEVFVAVAKKDYLDSLIQQFQEAEVGIEAVGIDMLACMQCLDFFYPTDFLGHTAILDLGVQLTTLGVVRSGKPRFIRDLSFGSVDISKKIKTRLNLGDVEIQDFIEGRSKVSEDQVSAFNESIENLFNDVKVSFDYYRDQSEDGSTPDKLLVCGMGSAQPFILSALQKALDLPVHCFEIASKIELSADANLKAYQTMIPDLHVALGLLLSHHD